MAMFGILADVSIGQWVELGISGVVLVAIGVALWIATKQFHAHNNEITKRNEDISKREEAIMKKSLEASQQIHDLFVSEQEAAKEWIKTQQDVMMQWAQNQTKSINKMLGILNNTTLPKKYTLDDEKKNVEFRKFLSQTLDSVRKKTGSSRALFCMFHNGTHSLNNINFYKFSLVGESWDINLAPVNGRIKDYQVAVYSNFLDMMTLNKKGFIIKDVEELKDNVATYQFFKSRGAKCAIVQAVYDENDGMMLGFIVNEFMDLHPEWDEKEWHAQKTPVTRAADRISGVFGVSSVDEEIRQEKKKETAMLENNKKLVFDVDANQIKIKKLLKKDFLELSMKAVSSANPNRNMSWFTPEAMEKALPTFYNKPILGCFNNGDFESHNGSWEKDGETGMSYWDTLGVKGERILGLIRSEDEVKIVEENGLKWITLTCALWTQYSFKQVKKLLKDAIRSQKEGGPTKNISVEIDVLDYDELPNGVMKINDFKLVGITILGSRNGKKIEPGIEDAELSVLDIVGTDNYEKQRSELRMAYAKLDEDKVKEEAKEMPNEKIIHQEKGKENFDCDEEHEEVEIQKCEEDDHEEPCENPECDDCNENHETVKEDLQEEHEEPQSENKGVYDLAYLMGSMKYNIDSFSQCIEYYYDHKEEIKNAEYVIAVIKRAKKKAEGITNLFAKAIGSLAEDSELKDPEEEEKLLSYEDCEEACSKYEALKAKYVEIKCECGDAEKKLEDLSKKYEEVIKKNAEFERKEFVSKAKSLIISSGCEEAIRDKFCKECEDGKYHDIDTLKTDIAVAMFDSNCSKVGNSDISLPISNPEVFSGDSAEKSPKKKSSWDTLNAYNKGEK